MARRTLLCCVAAFGLLLFSTAAYAAPDQSADLVALRQQIETLHKAAKFAEALPLAQKALAVSEAAFGPDDPETAKSLRDLGSVYVAKADYAKAEPLYKRALRICEQALGNEHPDTATSLDYLAQLYDDMGTYAKAQQFYERALKIREQTLGLEHVATAESLNNLAQLYCDMGTYAKAEPLHQRALKIREKTLGLEHPDTATSMDNLASVYGEMGDFARAERLSQRALTIREKVLGLEHPDTARSLRNLGRLYRDVGDFAKAEPLLKRELMIREKVLGLEHVDTAEADSDLGLLYHSMGDYAKAELFHQNSLKIFEKAFGADNVNIAASVNNLAAVYFGIGDYAKARPLYQRALQIVEKSLGSDSPDTAACTNNLARVYADIGDYAKAKPLYQRALRIWEKALGPDNVNTEACVNNLARLYADMGNYVEAKALFERALRICEKTLGPENPDVAISLNGLARVYAHTEKYAEAKTLYERALKIRKKTLEPEHPYIAESLNNLAQLHVDMEDPKIATNLAAQARQAQEKNLSNILSFASEQQRLAIQKTIQPYTLPGTLGDGPELAEIVLRQKGVVLDSLLEDRLVAETSLDPNQHEAVSALRSAKQRLMKLQLETPKDVSAEALKKRNAEKKELSQKVEELEAGLARQVAGLGRARRALSVTVPQVQAALGKGEGLIELLRYRHYLGKDKFEVRYGAVVIPPKGEPTWAPMGTAEEIEKNIQLYQKSARGQTDESTLSSMLRALHSQIWSPIEKALPAETKMVIISPDAELSFVSFATLIGKDDKFVGEKYAVRYVASGRDLLRESERSANATMLVYANPDFGGMAITARAAPADVNAVALRSVEMRDLQNISLPALPGTAAEAEALQKRFGSSAKLFLGANATKVELQQVNSPRILHLATHGFFLPEIDLGKSADRLQSEEETPKGKLVNPMHRSGLALAGAQTTLEAWSRGDVPPVENNGIVTAEEVGGLKLDGTWLVVLSACDTGSGEARAGEGVMGLRRGFIQAGAQNLLMTLWPISDQTTVQIMLDFYDAADKTHNAPQALADVQRDWLIKLRKQRGLLDAVRLAGAFIMSSQGKQ